MTELQKHLERLYVKLDYMGLRVVQTLQDTLAAVLHLDEELAQQVLMSDEAIDRQEVEIEKECIRLLALYQPAAVDLRRICFIIKVNSDLERIADLCGSIAKFVEPLATGGINVGDIRHFKELTDSVTHSLDQTIQLFKDASDTDLAHTIIDGDKTIDAIFRTCTEKIINSELSQRISPGSLFALLSVGRCLERIGDHCVNIAEDFIFVSTGEIIRHSEKLGKLTDE